MSHDQNIAAKNMPPEIQVEELPNGGVRYVLPYHPQWPAKIISLILVVAACILFEFLLRHRRLDGIEKPILLMLVGLYGFFNWCEIQLENGTLTNIRRWGPCFWRTPIPRSEILEFLVIKYSGPTSNASARAGFVLGDFYCISTGKKLIAAGYPRVWCEALARDLTQRWRPQLKSNRVAAKIQDRKRVRSRMVVTERPEGLVLKISPASFIRERMRFMFFFGLIWTIAVMGIMTLHFRSVPKGNADFWGGFAFLCLFGVVGIGMLVASTNFRRRSTEIAIAGGRLLFVEAGWLSHRKYEWEAAEIADLNIGRSQVRRVLELQIHTRGGQKIGFLMGHDSDELVWIAQTISRQVRKQKRLSAE